MVVQGAYSGAQAKPPLMHTPGLTSGPSPPPSGHYKLLQVGFNAILRQGRMHRCFRAAHAFDVVVHTACSQFMPSCE